ncbi:MAG: dihydrofolate reductase family protein [Solirubrobacterales bacterium]|nr:dihydrofolate reductase family protein [Solirubrobacterales bacterium]
MRKLIESTIVSLDGVVEAPDRWAPFDQESIEYAARQLANYDAFVMGRVSYERLRAIWEPVTGNPYIEAINRMPKYVATRTLDTLGWNATPLDDDLTAALTRLKAQHGKDLIKYGTSRIDGTLLTAGLIDEIRLWVMPVVVGAGQRLFEDINPKLELTGVRQFKNGSVILTYTPGYAR